MHTIFSRSLFDTIHEGIIVMDFEGNVMATNKPFYNMHGLSKDFSKKFTIYDSRKHFNVHYLDGKELPFDQWPFFQALQGVYLKNQIYKASNIDNGHSFFGLFNTSLFSDESQDTKAIIISITDISSYIEAKKNVEEKERLLSAIINNSEDGIHVLNLNSGCYDFMSPAQERLTGFSISELMFNLEEASNRLHPEDKETVNQYLEQVMQGKNPHKPTEYRWKTKSGEYRWFSDSRRAIMENGKPTKLVGVSRDITEKKQYEQDLEKLNELLTNMLYMAAHDIKSPLVNMKIMLQMMQENTSEIELFLPKLHTSVNNLESVIAGIGKLIEAQINNNLEISLIKLKDEIENIKSVNQAELDSCGGSIQVEVEDGLQFNFVKQYFDSIVGNLVSNAIKYRNPRRKLNIKVTAEREDNKSIKLMVCDNGTGIDLQKHGNNLFKPFKRFHPTVNGSGIGLYLIDNLIRKNGGSIAVDSKPKLGTCFTCLLYDYLPAKSLASIYASQSHV